MSFYEGTKHIFYTNNGNTVYIEPKTGQTLIVDGQLKTPFTAGSDTQIIYNDQGTLTGNNDARFFGGTSFLTEINTERIENASNKNTDGIGNLSGATNNLGNADAPAYGTCVEIYQGANLYTFLQSPDNGVFGGVQIYKDNIALTRLLYNTLPTNVSSDVQMSINEDATKIYFTDSSNLGNDSNYSYFTRSGDTFTFQDAEPGYRVSATGVYVAYSLKNNNTLVVRNTTGLSQIIYNGSDTTNKIYFHSMTSSNTLVFWYNNNIEVWTHNGTLWARIQTIPFATTPVSIDVKTNILVVGTATQLFIYERLNTTYTTLFNTTPSIFGVDPQVRAFTNGNSVFGITTTRIFSFLKSVNGWVELDVSVLVSPNMAYGAAVQNRLIVGTPNVIPNGGATHYSVDNDFRTLKNSIEIPTDGDITIRTEGNNLVIDSVETQINELSFIEDTGSNISPLDPNGFDIKVNNTTKVEIGNTRTRFTNQIQPEDGSEEVPAIVWDLNAANKTGIWVSGDQLNMKVRQATYSLWNDTAGSTTQYRHFHFYNPYLNAINPDINGSVLGIKAPFPRVGLTIESTLVAGLHNILNFYRNGVFCGAIQVNGPNTCTLLTTSDRRAKENIVNSTDSLQLINKLKVKKYNFKNDKQTVIGLIADEVNAIPELKHLTTMDGMTDAELTKCNELCKSIQERKARGEEINQEEEYKSKPRYHSMDYLGLIPILVGAINQLTDRVKILESKL